MSISSVFGLTGVEGFEELDEAWPAIKEGLLNAAIEDQFQNGDGENFTKEELSEHFDWMLGKLANGYTVAQLRGLTPEHLDAIYTLAHHVMQSGSVDDAACIFRLLTMLDSTSAKFCTAYGACLQMQNQFEQAMQVYSVAQLLDVSDPRIPQNAGVCCLHLNKLEEAKGLLTRANAMCEHFIEELPAVGIKANQERQEYKRLLDKGQQLLNVVLARIENTSGKPEKG